MSTYRLEINKQKTMVTIYMGDPEVGLPYTMDELKEQIGKAKILAQTSEAGGWAEERLHIYQAALFLCEEEGVR